MKIIMGDKQIQDLTPQTTNIGDRIVKNMRICGSGIYTYARQEADLLHLAPVPEKYKDLQWINVYRPAEVLNENKDKFARVPIITGRHVLVDRDNAKQLTVGMVGDTVDSEIDPDDGETYLYTTGTIVAGDGVDAYEQYGQLSVGYDPVIEWEEGIHKGVQYQAVLKGFNDVNHLLICKTARGGPQCMVMDSLDEFSPLERFVNKYNGGKEMNIFTKIFGSKQKSLAGDSALVSEILQSVSLGADPAVQIEKVRKLVGDSCDETFSGYLDELASSKGEDLSVVAKAVNIVDEYYKNNIAGDSKDEERHPDDCTCAECSKDKSVGDEDSEEKKGAGDEDSKEEEKDEKPSNGDSFELDYDLIANKVVEIIESRNKEEKVAGDEQKIEYFAPMSGDSKESEFTSDSLMNDIFGGK